MLFACLVSYSPVHVYIHVRVFKMWSWCHYDVMCCVCSYVSGGWGWSDHDKWQELTDEAAWWDHVTWGLTQSYSSHHEFLDSIQHMYIIMQLVYMATGRSCADHVLIVSNHVTKAICCFVSAVSCWSVRLAVRGEWPSPTSDLTWTRVWRCCTGVCVCACVCEWGWCGCVGVGVWLSSRK